MKNEIGEVQLKFAKIIWANEPINSGLLVQLCERELKWKKSTTYTVLKKLCEKNLFQNNKGIVTSLISMEEFYVNQSIEIVEDKFDGSLPAFIAAFTSKQKLSEKEIKDIKKMIEEAGR